MGFSSTQRQPCPPFWVSHTRTCSSSSRRFSASNNALCRVELSTTHSTNGSVPNAALFGKFLQFRGHSSFETKSSYKLEVGPDRTYPSKSSARLVLQPNMTRIKVLDYINPPKENEMAFSHNNGQMVEAMGSNPLNKHRDVGTLPLPVRNTCIKQRPSWTQLMKEIKSNEQLNIFCNVNNNARVDSASCSGVTEPLVRKNGNASGSLKAEDHPSEMLSSGKQVNGKKLNQLPSDDILVPQIPTKVKLKKPATLRNKSSPKGVDDAKEKDVHEMLSRIYEKVLVVDSPSVAKEVAKKLTNEYRHLIFACDTEVAKIDVKKDTPVDHGEIICFSIYGGPKVDFGNGKSCIWVDVLDGGGKDILVDFAPFFEDSCIQKVWHNYSFDNHVIENYGIKLNGFHADTMHMARLWDSSRRTEGGYSLEALTGDKKVMSKDSNNPEEELIGKVAMKTIFGRNKVNKDGSEGKITTIPPVEELQREERKPWICYSALDSISTLKLYENMKFKLQKMEWYRDGVKKGNMFTFYKTHWRPFGELLVKMETEGMLVDRAYLAEVEKVAISEQCIAVNRFRNWASTHCPGAKYMNVGSDTQLRQLLFGGCENRKDPKDILPKEKTFTVLNVNKMTEEGKPIAVKSCSIKLHKIGEMIPTEIYTATGWPSLSGDALKALSGKVSAEYEPTDNRPDKDTSAYGTAYDAFGKGHTGKEACHAIASLREACSINSLLSNFILPLQDSQISGNNGRIHCSLNINTETGRLSARRPNLQNQPALEKDRYKIRKAFVAAPGNSLIVADYGQLELRILAHLANCKSMLDAFKAGGDFHSRTAMNMYPHIREAVDKNQVLLEWDPEPGEDKPPVPLLKDAFASERRKAKMLNFSIAYGKTPVGLSKDWKVSVEEARNTVNLWYKERKEVKDWQKIQQEKAIKEHYVHTLLGRARLFPSLEHASNAQKAHIERAAINTPVQGSAADVAMCAMLEIAKNKRLKKLGWRLLLQVHDEVILEGPTDSAEVAKAIVVKCMEKPFNGKNTLNVHLSVDAKCAPNWYAAK